MSVAHERYLPPPRLTTPPPMDVSSIIHQHNTSNSIPRSQLRNSDMAQLPTQHPGFEPPRLQAPEQPVPNLEPVTTIHGGRIYSMKIVQQPIRARMCGFGDKDRRPITPPPCIRLIVKDATTGRDVDINDIDTAYFVLTVDLWSADGQKEVNLVRHSATSPSISAATNTSYPPPVEVPGSYTQSSTQPIRAYSMQSVLSPYEQAQAQHMSEFQRRHLEDSRAQQVRMMHQALLDHEHDALQAQRQGLPPPPPPPISTQPQTPGGYYVPSTAGPQTPVGQMGYYPQHLQPSQGPLLSPSYDVGSTRVPSAGMFTRNLIGSLCVSAFKLTSPDNELGVWFILQDLSVRTEGSFRLKMNFVNVGCQTSSIAGKLNTSSAPVLASCFSDVFHVFSAKKFPGVIESTGLSKCFATQGIKIPIRKDGPRGNEPRDGGDDDG